MHKITAVFLTILFLSACSDDAVELNEKIEKFVANLNVEGVSGKDYWISKHTAFGRTKVVLVFGYMDNFRACLEIIETENRKYPAANFLCEAAQ